jgi:hypothetical protein
LIRELFLNEVVNIGGYRKLCAEVAAKGYDGFSLT